MHPTRRSVRAIYLMLSLLFASGGLVLLMSGEDFIIWRDGKPALSPARKGKLDRELEAFENAEQYALIAEVPGQYPCFNCPEATEIFLLPGEVWKYGVTTKGREGRYVQGLPFANLLYIIEFEGTLQKCLQEEKLKIYQYALLPENLKRKKPLIRPPGNKRDN
mgnify:CR=1 FL=1